MSYNIIKSFKIDLKKLTITGKYSPSNVRDYNDRRPIHDFEQTFDSLEKLEEELVLWANNYLSGEHHFPKNHTFSKRVDWLIKNGYGNETKEISNWYYLKGTREIIDILSGKTKIKHKQYVIIVKYDPTIERSEHVHYNMILKSTPSKIQLSSIGDFHQIMTLKEIIASSKGTRRLSKLNESEMEHITRAHKDFLERYKAEVVEV